MSPTDLIVLGLATWRLTSLIVWEAGPWDIFHRLRYLAGVRYGQDSERTSERMLGQLMSCPWCASVWLGAILAACYLVEPTWSLRLALPLALSAIVVIIEKAVSHGEG